MAFVSPAIYISLFGYYNIISGLLLLLMGGLILYHEPRRKVNRALFFTALMGAVVMLLDLITRELTLRELLMSNPPWEITGFYWDVIRPICGYLFVTAWYLEFWFFLQYLLECHWESGGERVGKERRRRARLFTLLPMILWIAFLIAFYRLAPDFPGLFYYLHLALTLLYILPFILMFWGLPRRTGEGFSTGKLLFQWFGFFLRVLGLGIILIILGPLMGNILLAIFVVIVFLNYLFRNRSKGERAATPS